MESIEYAQERTQKFINLTLAEMGLMGIDSSSEPFLAIAAKAAPHLTTPEEHYELRKWINRAFSSAAYKYLYKKWSAGIA